MLPEDQDRSSKGCILYPGERKTARKTAGDIAKNHCHPGPGRPAYEYDVRPRHLSEPENG